MSTDLQVWELILHASWMVKFVMLLLLGFSIMSWFIIFRKHIMYNNIRKTSSEFLETFWKSKNLAEANKTAEITSLCPEAAIFRSGYNELQKLNKSRPGQTDAEETLEMRLAGMENLKRVLRKAESMELYHLGKSLSFLATTQKAVRKLLISAKE